VPPAPKSDLFASAEIDSDRHPFAPGGAVAQVSESPVRKNPAPITHPARLLLRLSEQANQAITFKARE